MSYRIVFSDDCSGDEVVAFPLTAEQVNQLRKHMYQLGRDVEAIEDLPQKLYDVAIWVEKKTSITISHANHGIILTVFCRQTTPRCLTIHPVYIVPSVDL